MQYKKLNKEILENKNRKTIPSDEALTGIIPMQWSDEVINGSKKVTIGKASH